MSLGVKLYASIFAVMFIGLSIFTYLNVKSQQERQLELVQLSALRTTDLIKNSLHYSMLINRKEDIEQIFKNLGSMQGFEAIRLYDKKGQVVYSTRLEEKLSKVSITSEACQVCHYSATPLKELAVKERHRITLTGNGTRVLSMIAPIQNEVGCSSADCHEPLSERAILGVLDVQMSLALVDAGLAKNQRNTVAASAILVISVLLVTGILIWTLIRVPVNRLTAATRVIAGGNLQYKIPVHRRDEIGELAKSFNTMVEELSRAQSEITEWSHTLQQKVKQKTGELEQIQTHLIHVEKMASLGKLAATVAHELNNPLGGILTYTRLTQKRLSDGQINPEILNAILEDLAIVKNETIRCGNIVNNLLLFSRRDMGECEFKDVKTILDSCVKLVQHHLSLQQIRLNQVMPDGPVEARCDKEQIQQAVLAIVMNAIEAMPHGGTLTVGAFTEGDNIKISITDTGEGISDEHLPHIFEPFYTSKKDGKGIGLGLSVAYGIVERHKGQIDLESVVGKGTTFIITIPRDMQSIKLKDSGTFKAIAGEGAR
jgi:two-component system NtrC family sensor kinase